MTRLAILCTHPIQYFAPVFAELAKCSELELKVFYGWRGATENSLDRGFGKSIQWDVPLLSGYKYEFVDNTARDPGSHHFGGIRLPTLRARLEKWNADALLVYGWSYTSHLGAIRYFKDRIPVLFRGDSTLLNQSDGWRSKLRSVLRSAVLRYVYRHVDMALAVGTRNREYFLKYGLQPSQICFAPHAVDNQRFATAATPALRCHLRSEHRIGTDEVAVLLPAKLEPVKNPFLLLRAFREIADSGCHLLFAGSGPLEKELRCQATPQTHFLGFQNQSKMPGIYSMSDVVVLPSLSETWGLVLNEAMACGKAVIASDRVGAAIDLIRPGENGWLFESGNLDDLTACLRKARALGADGLRDLGARSAELIAEWSIDRQVQAIRSAVAHCVAERGRAIAR